jgi:putative membrane protein
MSAFDSPSTELAARRTGMSFQRTRMAADRTLMAVIRTALSLIGFGFTIYQFIGKLAKSTDFFANASGRQFGLSLVVLGSVLLTLGIVYHVRFMQGLRQEREALKAHALLHAESAFPPSLTLITAVLLLLLGLVAISSMAFRIGPFG